MASEASASSALPVVLRFADGRTEAVTIDRDMTVAQLKAEVAPKIDTTPDRLRLVYAGHMLKDDRSVGSYDIASGATVHVVKAAANSLQADVGQPARSPAAAGPAGGGIPSLASMQQRLQANPEMMRQMLNSPITDMLLNNPELMRSVMMANPEMQALAERNPELAHMLNDPALLRQSLEYARNPSMMAELQRNTDRAMQNIEMLPGGFDALRRMYRDVQQPMLDAHSSLNSSPRTPSSARPQVPLPPSSSPNTMPLPNPWASPATPAAASGTTATASPFGAAPGLASLFRPPTAPTAPSATTAPSAAPGAPTSGPPAGLFPWMRARPPPPFFGMGLPPGLDDDDANDPLLMQAIYESMLPQTPSSGASAPTPPAGVGMPPFGLPPWMAAWQALNRMQQGAASATPPSTAPAAAAAAAGPSAAAPAAEPAPDWAAYETKFAAQLEFMAEMGFTDKQRNIRALLAAGGNVDSAVERLIADGAANDGAGGGGSGN